MKIGIISDIHSNYDALKRVIEIFEKEKVDKYICLGDIIGFGKYPDKCVDFFIKNKDKFLSIIRGNHEGYLINGIPKTVHNIKNGRLLDNDEYLNHKYNHSKLNNDQILFIKSLKENDLIEVNGFKISINHYPKEIFFSKYVSENEAPLIFNNIEADIYLFGHTHIERYYKIDDKYYINPGTVGCPVIINSASCGILNITNHVEYKHLFVKYDVNKTIEELSQESIPANDKFLNIFYGKNNRILNVNYKDKLIKGFLEIPKVFREKYPLVILVHGFNGTYKHGLIPAGKKLARSGFLTYSFDFINGSNDSISGGNIYNISLEDEFNQLKEVVKVLSSLENVDKSNIYLFGRSQGGFLSSYLVSKNLFNIKGLILYYPAFNIVDIAHNKFKNYDNIKDDEIFFSLVNRKYFQDAYNINIDNILDNINVKTLLFHGTIDELVPISYSNYASKRIKNVKYFIHENETHGFRIQTQLEDIKIIENFIKENY